MNIKKSILIRVYFLLACLVLFALAILFQIFNLQVNEKARWANASKSQSIRFNEVEATRGNIYAANGELLATSLPKYDAFWDTKAAGITKKLFEEKIDSLAMLLSRNLGIKSENAWRLALRNARAKGERYFKLQHNIDYQIAKKMKNWPIFNLGKYKGGLVLDEKSTRSLPYGMLAARTVGFSRPDYHVGIEGSLDSVLAGINGKRLERKMYGGVWRPLHDENSIDPEEGLDIYTTIDIELQDVAEDALYRTLVSNNAKHGAVVLMEVATGAIKAIANLQRQQNGEYVESYNYVIGQATDPGSTFKLVSFMALLEDNKIKLTDSIDTEWGETTFYGQKMLDATKPLKRYQTLQRCFESSSNVGTSKAIYEAYRSNPAGFLKHVKKARFNEKVGIEIKGEALPTIKEPGDKDWYATSLPWMSIGYEILVSPIQIAAFYNAIANDGKMMKPYLISEVKSADKIISSYTPTILDNKVCSKNTAKTLRKLMEGVVANGTAQNLKDLGLKVAGKTGTAQLALPGGGYSKTTHSASFAGYFPADNPKYTCYVVVSEPSQGVYYGGLIAGPVFREIADKVYASGAYLRPIEVKTQENYVPMVLGGYTIESKQVLNQLGISFHNTTDSWPDWASTAKKGLAITFTEKTPSLQKIPNVLGWGLRDAIYILEKRGLKVEVFGYGKVVFQSLIPNSNFDKGATIKIRLNP